MEEKKNTDNGMTEISHFLIDFDALENYRDENGMPLLSVVRSISWETGLRSILIMCMYMVRHSERFLRLWIMYR